MERTNVSCRDGMVLAREASRYVALAMAHAAAMGGNAPKRRSGAMKTREALRAYAKRADAAFDVLQDHCVRNGPVIRGE